MRPGRCGCFEERSRGHGRIWAPALAAPALARAEAGPAAVQRLLAEAATVADPFGDDAPCDEDLQA